MCRGKQIMLLLCVFIAVICTGCKNEEASVSQVQNEVIEQSTNAEEISGEAPEGYVYDYQVSMEPIPKEIADLGGTCCGTMHAFPSRIMAGLTEQKLENDPELKEEAEKRTKEVKETLENEIGGEFDVQVMEIEDKLTWRFLCTEKATNNQFGLQYFNYEYAYPEDKFAENFLSLTSYYALESTMKHGDTINNMIMEIFGNVCHDVYIQEDVNETTIYLAEFTNDKIVYNEWQIKILKLWEQLNNYNEQMDYRIYLGIYPPQYEEVIMEKCEKGVYMDTFVGYNTDGIKELINREEIHEYFSYIDHFEEEKNINLDVLLEKYKDNNYDENEIWEYWLGK